MASNVAFSAAQLLINCFQTGNKIPIVSNPHINRANSSTYLCNPFYRAFFYGQS